jgi:ribosome maturation factor RimP
MSKTIESTIEDLLAKIIENAGYALVRVHVSGGGKYAALQIMVERRDEVGMTVEDCAKISKLVSAQLESDKDLADKYDLEVSSPGIDRPLVKLKDYERFQGHVAKIDLEKPFGKHKRFQGAILSVTGSDVEFETETGPIKVAFDQIEKAKLVLTDKLLKAAQSGKVSH